MQARRCESQRRVNHVNARREFFFGASGEVHSALTAKAGNLLVFTEHAESSEYLQSVHYGPEANGHPRPSPPSSSTPVRD